MEQKVDPKETKDQNKAEPVPQTDSNEGYEHPIDIGANDPGTSM